MADKDISPEKRLLNIIENKEGEEPKQSPIQEGKKLFSIGALKARISFLKEKLSKGPIRFSGISFGLKEVNTLLQVCIGILAIYLGISVKMKFTKLMNKDWGKSMLRQEVFSGEVEAVASLVQPKDFYLSKVKTRNLFDFADQEQKEKVNFKEDEKKGPSKLEEMTKNFKLVGISWSEDPDAIIEDSDANKTYFVKTGSSINEIKVQAIHEDRVILHYGMEEVELR